MSKDPSPSKLYSFVGKSWLRAFGWTLDGGPPNVKRAVVVAAPHTSSWDFPFTMAVASALGIRISWMGKHTLFKPPFGSFFRWFGGLPVNRGASHNAVAAAAELIRSNDELFLIVAPEGTRGKTTRWKTGFYYMALEAKVPIVLGYLDYEKKHGGLGELFFPTGDIEADMKQIRAFYANVRGKHPNRESETEVAAAPPEKTVPDKKVSEQPAASSTKPELLN